MKKPNIDLMIESLRWNNLYHLGNAITNDKLSDLYNDKKYLKITSENFDNSYLTNLLENNDLLIDQNCRKKIKDLDYKKGVLEEKKSVEQGIGKLLREFKSNSNKTKFIERLEGFITN